MVDQFAGADSGFSARSSSENNGVEVRPCRLHLMSPTFRSVKDFTGKLASQFAHEVGREIREVVETFQGYVRFLPMENCEQQYVDQCSMGLIASEFTYRFPIGMSSAAGFLTFDSLLPRCFTEVCFGGHISKADGSAVLSKIDRYLMGKVASRLIRAWLQKWKVVFEDDHRDEVGMEWLGDCPSNTGLMKESCFRVSFEIGFELECTNDDNQEASLKFPIHFFLPILPLEHAMISCRLPSEPSMDLQCYSNISVLLSSTVSITAEMMKLSLPITKAKALKAGDVIPVEPLGEARVLIEGAPFAKAEVVQQSGNLVLKVNDITFSGVANDRCH